ncbi:MAG TPA: DUF3318 domain-containing protein [Trinickia sp.]|uniref:DUF3318 domain-containing protein n=1 Tax=Trinickia sp. TaxID=2571163 RepID=UPI002C87031F|nr:DUF3318 domain-containing protein [Trinickia sp.]HVW49824.1 DUF3318 domain-containing protein [Trinickia sp.]
MSQTPSPSSTHRRSSPVHDSSTLQMRAVRKELLLLRAEVERSEFVQARLELHRKFANLSWLGLLVPGFGLGRARPKTTGRGVNATLSDWVLSHPLVSSLASLILTKPLRATVAAGAKPLLKWGALGAAGWAGLRLWSHLSSRKPQEQEAADGASDAS